MLHEAAAYVRFAGRVHTLRLAVVLMGGAQQNQPVAQLK